VVNITLPNRTRGHAQPGGRTLDGDAGVRAGLKEHNIMRSLRWSKPAACLAAATITLGWLATAARAQVLDQIPSDALVVIKVNNLKVVSDKVAKFSEAIGLSAVSPEFANPLQSMQDQMKIKQGLDTAGEMAIVVTKGAAEAGSPDDAMLVLLPVTNFKDFLSNFTDVKEENGVTAFKAEGEEMNAANWGKYAAVAKNAELLKAKPSGLKLSGLAAKEAKEKDGFVFANIPALAQIALPKIEAARKEALGDIDRELGKNDQAKEFAGVAKAAFGQILNIAEGFLKDSTGASFSVHLDDKGLQTCVMADFKPDSYAGKLVAQLKNTDQPLMGGLPARKYFAAGGATIEPSVASKVIGDLLDPISKELANTNSGKGFAAAIDSLKHGAAATKSVAFGYPMPMGAIGADSILQSITVAKGDSAALYDAQKKMLAGMSDLMKLMPQQPGAPKVNYEMTPAAKTVGDVKLDTWAFNMQMDENNPQAQQMQQVMAFVYGPNGMGGTFGPVSKDSFLVVQGGTDKLLKDAVEAAKGNADPLSGEAGVKDVTMHLPKERVLVDYVFVDNIVNAAVRYAQGFGVQVKVALPQNLPPLGFTMASEGTAIRFDGFVPTNLVQSVVAAGMKAFMDFQGGGGAGGPGGL
jgi:hypothetical protein